MFMDTIAGINRMSSLFRKKPATLSPPSPRRWSSRAHFASSGVFSIMREEKHKNDLFIFLVTTESWTCCLLCAVSLCSKRDLCELILSITQVVWAAVLTVLCERDIELMRSKKWAFCRCQAFSDLKKGSFYTILEGNPVRMWVTASQHASQIREAIRWWSIYRNKRIWDFSSSHS